MTRSCRNNVVRYRLRLAAYLVLVPSLTFASIGYDIVSVDSELPDPHGFAVRITPEHPYLRIEVDYPQSIDGSLEAKFAVIGYWSEPGEIRLMVRAELGTESGLPIELSLTMKPEIADASVDIHYVCVSKSPGICTAGAETIFHIKSIRAFHRSE